MRRAALVTLAAGLVLVGSGCDWSKPGGKDASPTPETVVGTVEQQKTVEIPQQFAGGDPGAGKSVFQTAGCSGCHTLAAAGSNGNVGPNLDDAKPDLALIVERVRKGKGAMPPFEDNLKVEQIRDVAAFVYDSTHGQDSG